MDLIGTYRFLYKIIFSLINRHFPYLEMRQKFDNGEDPLDPEEQRGGGNPFQGGHPFHFRGNPFGGGFPGGGGGHSFKFHFN